MLRGIAPISFATIDMEMPQDLKCICELTGGIPIELELGAKHIEEDIAFAIAACVRHSRRPAQPPDNFLDKVSVSTIPALALARQYLGLQWLF